MVDELIEKLEVYAEYFDKERMLVALNLMKDHVADEFSGHAASLEMVESLIPLRPDCDTLLAALLHKVHSAGFLKAEQVKEALGGQVATILDGVLRLEGLVYSQNDRAVQIENLRKMIFVIAKDVRVILVALACRLYKMHHLEEIYVGDQISDYSAETLSLYVPICARLGMYNFKGQLEDLAFKYFNEEEYKNISKQLDGLRKSCKLSIAYIKEQLDKFLAARGVEAEVSGRIKNLYSIYRKMKRKGLNSVGDLYDIFAMRVIIPVKKDENEEVVTDHLYGILGLLHSEWKPISKKFKDYLAVPKPNGYRSLHTVVLGLAPKDANQPVEIQIRDANMHREAEYGVASHWIYKESGKRGKEDVEDSQLELIKGLEGIRSELDLDHEIIRELEIDLFKDKIFVLTPRGEVKEFPAGAVPIDFAYAVHTDVGNKCIMAKVNGSVVPLDYELQSNDVVEIITRKDASPKLRWLSIVKTSQARNKIKNYFSAFNRDNNIKEGKRLMNDQLARISKPLLDQKFTVLKNLGDKSLTLAQRESLLEEIGSGGKFAGDIVRKIYPYRENVIDEVYVSGKGSSTKGKEFKELSEKVLIEDQVLVGGESGLPIKIASCCTPSLNSSIVGYVTRGNSITIHRTSCTLIENLKAERIISASWKGDFDYSGEIFLVGIKVKAICRVGLMSDISSVISSLGINIRDVILENTRNGMTEEYFLLDLKNLDIFDTLLDKLEEVKGVVKVSKDDKFKSRNK